MPGAGEGSGGHRSALVPGPASRKGLRLSVLVLTSYRPLCSHARLHGFLFLQTAEEQRNLQSELELDMIGEEDKVALVAAVAASVAAAQHVNTEVRKALAAAPTALTCPASEPSHASRSGGLDFRRH